MFRYDPTCLLFFVFQKQQSDKTTFTAQKYMKNKSLTKCLNCFSSTIKQKESRLNRLKGSSASCVLERNNNP